MNAFSELRKDPRLDRLRPVVRRVRKAAHGVGIDFSMRTEDRRVLETIILPALQADPKVQTILFVGCDWYTHKYERMFADRTYWTLEIDADKRVFGSRGRHVVDSLAAIRQHFERETFDVIICNGVLGWGLDDQSEVEAAFSGCHACLTPGGLLVLGWNDVDVHRPRPLDAYAWVDAFEPYVFEPLGTQQYEVGTDNQHMYSFYVRPAADR